MTNAKQSILYASDSRGIFIPQYFAESYDSDMWEPISVEAMTILKEGPESEQYWDTWQEVLDSAETIDGGILHQDGDLWVVWAQLAIDTVNSFCSDQLKYEETHEDSGDGYAFMVAESWCAQVDSDLARDMKQFDLNPMGLDTDTLSDIALDLFTMESGHIFSNMSANKIVLGSHPLQEIEIHLANLSIDEITMDLIRESCDAYITGTDRAYSTTDCVWYAVLEPDTFQQAIIDYVELNKETI
tara:strand:+ start:1866 stop:2594 length:729 start_codon:yes stop_codon:yes gene_type:complete